jgi:hypothetical protein
MLFTDYLKTVVCTHKNLKAAITLFAFYSRGRVFAFLVATALLANPPHSPA